MNKKFLICGALAMGLLLTACVKKEEPKDEQTETAQAASEPTEQVQFQPLEASQPEAEVVIPAQVEVERQETPNTTTEIRREVREEAPKPAATEVTEAPKKVEDKPAQQPKPNYSTQSEDDAVAAAIAAATPALDNK
ncbi:internalin [Acinetobacter zhairhuonensis]|jgi:PBP1b-binding outer membrane lipoprotein LpoB|uniref:internalin n=1 Tax=Acinetobacter sp. A7.4 TaxID=2919921 RepID=UPI001F4EE35B|nr:internalin [Acinetobacter sp. A7.4]MCJ8160699.1 internalin [Acinetobacter sp. A7.4]